MEKLQITADDQKKLPRSMTPVMEQRRPRTKAAPLKVTEKNATKRKKTEASGGHRRQESGDTKAVDLLTTE